MRWHVRSVTWAARRILQNYIYRLHPAEQTVLYAFPPFGPHFEFRYLRPIMISVVVYLSL